MIKILVKKLQSVSGGLPAAPMESFAAGAETPPSFSLPIDYTMEGELTDETNLPQVGRSFCFFRTSRNGVPALGICRTTPVTEVLPHGFRTANSFYQLNIL